MYEDSHGYEVKTNCHQCRVIGAINAPKNAGSELKKNLEASKTLINGKEKGRRLGEPNQL